MYIWTAIDIDSQLIEQKEIVKSIEKEIDFKMSNVSLLPLHISLKISADVNDKDIDNVVNDILSIYDNTNKFTIDVDKIEESKNIVWIKMKENENLIQLHELLCKLFKENYNVSLHEFDSTFVYHTTFFLDDDTLKINKAFNLVKNITLPEKIEANKFIIGFSKTGKVGTYKVFKNIEK